MKRWGWDLQGDQSCMALQDHEKEGWWNPPVIGKHVERTYMLFQILGQTGGEASFLSSLEFFISTRERMEREKRDWPINRKQKVISSLMWKPHEITMPICNHSGSWCDYMTLQDEGGLSLSLSLSLYTLLSLFNYNYIFLMGISCANFLLLIPFSSVVKIMMFRIFVLLHFYCPPLNSIIDIYQPLYLSFIKCR